MGRRALVLFAHGARSASWAEPFERLQEQVASLAKQGVDDVTVVPVFLGQGGHVLRDLPLILDEMRLAHPAVKIHAVGAVGEDPTVLQAMTDYCIKSVADGA